MKTILFACVHNAGRSQMAAAWFNALANPAEAIAVSAGTQPASQVHPQVLEVMREVGVDLSNARPRFLDEALAKQSSVLITMGCGEACPFVPGLEREDWPLTDPKGQSLESIRAIRDEIKLRVQDLLTRRGIAVR
jgi:arsenate reductase